jgi:cytochrome c-type biogenesis protein CcmH
MSATQTEIEEALTCQCGCGLTVHSCNHLTCPSAIPLRQEIGSQLALGKTRAEVLAYFGGKYGEKILSAPTTSGFNLVAWVTPFAVVLVAAAIIVKFARRSRRRGPTEAAVPAPAIDKRDAEQRERLAAELERFDV